MTIQFSGFAVGNDAQVGDLIVGLRAGLNTLFTFPNDGIKDANGNFLLNWTSAGVNASNYVSISNGLYNSSGNGVAQILADSPSTGVVNANVNLMLLGTGPLGVVEIFAPFGTHMVIPSGSTADAITGAAGGIRYNTDVDLLYFWDVSTDSWQSITANSVTSVTASAPLASSGGTTPNISLTGIVLSTNGGTGVNNGAATLTLGDSAIFVGAYPATFNFTGVTNVTFPTSGVLATTGGTVSTVTASAPLSSSGGTSPNISFTGILPSANGGTGFDNDPCTLEMFSEGPFTAYVLDQDISTAGYPEFVYLFIDNTAFAANFCNSLEQITATGTDFGASVKYTWINGSINQNVSLPGAGGGRMLGSSWWFYNNMPSNTLTVVYSGVAQNPLVVVPYQTWVECICTAYTTPPDDQGIWYVNPIPGIAPGASLTTTGVYNSNFNFTGNTNVTFPNSGTLATIGGTVSTVTASAPITSSGGTSPNIALTTPLIGTYGGTGVNNGNRTLTLDANLHLAGSFTTPAVFNMTASTNVTFPISGTLLNNINPAANNFIGASTSTASAGGTTTLTSASNLYQIITGSLGQTFQLPAATTLTDGWSFEFNNNSSGIVTIQDGGANVLYYIPSGGYSRLICLTNGTTAGTWDVHSFLPSNCAFGNNGATISGNLNVTGTTEFNGSYLALAGNLTTSGAYASTFTMTGVTTVVFPTSGTLATVAGTVSSITGTANQIAASASTGAVTLSLANNAVMPGTGGLTFPQGNTAARAGAAGTMRFNSQTNVFELTLDGSTWGTVTTTTTAITSVTASAPITSSGGTNPNIALTTPLVGTYGGTGVNNGSSTFTIGGNTAFSGAYTFTGTLTAATAVTFPTSGVLFSTAAVISPTYGGTGVNNGSNTITLGGNLTTSGAYTTTLTATATTSVTMPPSGTLISTINPGFDVCNGRLTLTSNTPVTTADTTTGTGGTIYFTPYKGSYITLYDGTNWNLYTFTQLSITSTLLSGQMGDVFIYNNSGTLTLAIVTWSTLYVRATALAVQNGVYVLSGTPSRRYLGTVYGPLVDTANIRGVWNYYNRVPKSMAYLTTTSWTYGSTTIRQANGSSNYQINYIVGIIEDIINASVSYVSYNGSTAGQYTLGFGNNSTTSFSGCATTSGLVVGSAQCGSSTANFNGYPSTLGLNYLAWLESAFTATATLQSAMQGTVSSGIQGTIPC